MHRYKERDTSWYKFYANHADDWKAAHRKLVEFIFLDDPPDYPRAGRQNQADHKDIDFRLTELYDIITHFYSREWRYRTRFGDKKLPCSECTQNRYSKMRVGENLAGLWMGLGCDKEDGLATAMGLPTDPESDFLYMPLHRFSLVPELAEQHDLAAALKAYFWKEVQADSEVDTVCMRLFLNEEMRTTIDSPDQARALWATALSRIKNVIEELEAMRIKFPAKCDEAYPVLDKLREAFEIKADDEVKVGAKRKATAPPPPPENSDSGSEADGEEGSDEEESSDSDEGDEEDDDQQTDMHHKKLPSIQRAEVVQLFDNFSCHVTRARGTKDARKTKFKGEPEPHVAELLYAIIFTNSNDYYDRIPEVKAPTFGMGADLVWFDPEPKEGNLCRFKNPPKNPIQGTIIKSKIDSMGKEGKKIAAAYLEVQSMARRLNNQTRKVFKFIADTFSLKVCLELKGGQAGQVYQYTNDDLTLTQELCIFHVYMNAIYQKPENNPDHDIEEREEERVALGNDGASSSEADSDSDEDYEEGEDGESEESDDDSESSGSGSDSYSDSDSDIPE